MQFFGENPGSDLFKRMTLNTNTGTVRLPVDKISKGALIVIEGIDGTGKSTLTHNLAKLVSREIQEKVVVTHEPTERMLEVTQALDQHDYTSLGSRRRQALEFVMDHAIHLADVIIPALAADKLVICDRWTPISGSCYQGPVVGDLCKTWDIKPDAIIILDLNLEQALKRIDKRKAPASKFEDPWQLEQTLAKYKEIIDKYPSITYSLDANLDELSLTNLARHIAIGSLLIKRHFR